MPWLVPYALVVGAPFILTRSRYVHRSGIMPPGARRRIHPLDASGPSLRWPGSQVGNPQSGQVRLYCCLSRATAHRVRKRRTMPSQAPLPRDRPSLTGRSCSGGCKPPARSSCAEFALQVASSMPRAPKGLGRTSSFVVLLAVVRHTGRHRAACCARRAVGACGLAVTPPAAHHRRSRACRHAVSVPVCTLIYIPNFLSERRGQSVSTHLSLTGGVECTAHESPAAIGYLLLRCFKVGQVSACLRECFNAHIMSMCLIPRATGFVVPCLCVEQCSTRRHTDLARRFDFDSPLNLLFARTDESVLIVREPGNSQSRNDPCSASSGASRNSAPARMLMHAHARSCLSLLPCMPMHGWHV